MPIQGFNPALGTLNEVDCLNCSQATSGGSATMTITVTNLNPFPEPFEDEEAFIFITVGTPTGAGWINGLDEFTCPVGPLDPGASQTIDCLDHQFELASSPLVSPKDLAGFISTGNVILPLSFDRVSLPLVDSGQTVTFDSASMTVNVDVACVYTPAKIPEPASGIPLITAMLIFSPYLWNRRHRSSGS
jgi:hypothetical protein